MRYPKMARAVECNVTIGGTEARSKGDAASLIPTSRIDSVNCSLIIEYIHNSYNLLLQDGRGKSNFAICGSRYNWH